MNKPKFKVGDWVFADFELKQIKEMRGDKVTTVSNGFISSGRDGHTVFPMTMEVKQISECFHSWSRKIHDRGMVSLNYPAIAWWLESKWEETCNLIGNDEAVKRNIAELDKFGRKVLDRCEELSQEELSGIKLFYKPSRR